MLFEGNFSFGNRLILFLWRRIALIKLLAEDRLVRAGSSEIRFPLQTLLPKLYNTNLLNTVPVL